jgi:hypothetical protein
MNERIQELAEQAGFYHMGIGLIIGIEEYHQKFAELIVGECVQSIEKTIETNCDTDSEKIGCEFAITGLLEHFGVKR